MKKFAYTLVTSPQHDSDNAAASRVERSLTLRETLVIDDGPSYQREYIVAADGFGFTADAESRSRG